MLHFRRRVLQLVWGIGLVVMLWSCRPTHLSSWQTYHNARYGFEFLYPSHWIALPMPENRDGQAFSDPQNPDAEIRGFAGEHLPNIPEAKTLGKPNFTTEQGVKGRLKVRVDQNISTMTLMLSQGGVHYTWQGKSQSDRFADYYRFFYYIAIKYRI